MHFTHLLNRAFIQWCNLVIYGSIVHSSCRCQCMVHWCTSQALGSHEGAKGTATNIHCLCASRWVLFCVLCARQMMPIVVHISGPSTISGRWCYIRISHTGDELLLHKYTYTPPALVLSLPIWQSFSLLLLFLTSNVFAIALPTLTRFHSAHIYTLQSSARHHNAAASSSYLCGANIHTHNVQRSSVYLPIFAQIGDHLQMHEACARPALMSLYVFLFLFKAQRGANRNINYFLIIIIVIRLTDGGCGKHFAQSHYARARFSNGISDFI